MLFARRIATTRRLWWPTSLGILIVSCGTGTTVSTVVPTPTSVVITPDAFLGPVACGSEPGGLLSYQVTLIDVTDGLADAPTLPSSPVADCTSTVVFETVEIGHRYGARIAAFDRPGLSAESSGSPIVVDESGGEILPKWTTTCTGYDGETDFGLGGGGGLGGGPSGNISLGVLAVEHAAVPIRGCAPLSGEFDPELTGIRVDLTQFLGTLSCGSGAGEVLNYSAVLATEHLAAGGAGGMGGSGEPAAERTACDVPFVLRGLEPGQWVTLEVQAFEDGATEPSWTTACDARPELGALINASCGTLRAL